MWQDLNDLEYGFEAWHARCLPLAKKISLWWQGKLVSWDTLSGVAFHLGLVMSFGGEILELHKDYWRGLQEFIDVILSYFQAEFHHYLHLRTHESHGRFYEKFCISCDWKVHFRSFRSLNESMWINGPFLQDFRFWDTTCSTIFLISIDFDTPV